jgi:hypothetical protein
MSCRAITRKSIPCKCRAKKDQIYCHIHTKQNQCCLIITCKKYQLEPKNGYCIDHTCDYMISTDNKLKRCTNVKSNGLYCLLCLM